MSKRTEIHIGDKYGRLSIIKEIEPKIWGNQSHRQVLCKCECGNVIKIELTKLVTGYTKPCGCVFMYERSDIHSDQREGCWVVCPTCKKYITVDGMW